MQDLRQFLIDSATGAGICKKGLSHMEASDIDALVDYYINNPDWCLERSFPSLEVLRDNFSNIEDKGVFVGKTFSGQLLNDLQVYVFHNCQGTIKVGLNVDKRIIPMIYLANGCRLKIQGVGEIAPGLKRQRTIIPIYTFGKNDLSAKDNRFVRFLIHKNKLI